MENKFYITTYWQSLDMLQSKVDRKTCDFIYERYDGAPHPRPRKDTDEFSSKIIPAWSIGRMWEMLYEQHLPFEYCTDMSPQDVINSLVDTLRRHAENF